ncbi:MBL fold metallo-hydrolase [Aequorivita sp. SDUM287046]|uniref:MBL fold metallo-hydrolase n=1 Tax=Aequorivita aurantiaca TaxID=3053356 RepID=A0ABT8DIA9_9FLAO|nr:MBL fold metallo-hydrolase [Aequorivita aurantiaca]MDN3725073.1 MBL fold metallo-hydrolase [Aequorivita aurantiaca]
MKRIAFTFILAIALFGCKNTSEKKFSQTDLEEPVKTLDGGEAAEEKGFTINPVEHASMVLNWDGTIIYVDPVGGKEIYNKYSEADMILVTDIHGDHMDIPTLEAITKDKTVVFAPKAVFEKLPTSLQNKTNVINNGDVISDFEMEIRAVPMYNLRPEALKFHEKGRGNGYVLERNGKRIYISGDTEDIPEMRNLQNIDIAFICMNLPYTMTVEKAAEAVLAFKPKTVYPYHYRGTEGMSDVEKFKNLVEAGSENIKVTQLDWYPKK